MNAVVSSSIQMKSSAWRIVSTGTAAALARLASRNTGTVALRARSASSTERASPWVGSPPSSQLSSRHWIAGSACTTARASSAEVAITTSTSRSRSSSASALAARPVAVRASTSCCTSSAFMPRRRNAC